MKICIATGGYHKPGETFINAHIERLFEGQTVVICNKKTGGNPYDKAVVECRPRKQSVGQAMLRSGRGLVNLVRHRSSAIPTGAKRAEIERFWADQNVSALLCEFGSEAIRLSPIADAMGLPVLSYFRGYDASKDLRSARVCEAYRRAMPRLAGVIAVSQFLLDNLAAKGITHPHSRVIPSGVNTDRFTPGEKRPGSCLAVGRMIEKKAPDLTVRAFCTAARDVPHARLDVMGDGPMLEHCKAIARQAGMADRVIFHGAQPHEVVREHLARTQFFLQHSVTAKNGNTEGMPTAIQEAMAAGAVTISTRHAGIPEAIEDGRSGYLVDEWDEAGFRDHIARALSDPDGAAAMAQHARAVALDRFDNRKLWKSLEAFIAERVAAVA